MPDLTDHTSLQSQNKWKMKNGHSKGGEEENVVASTDLYTSPMRHTLSDLAT